MSPFDPSIPSPDELRQTKAPDEAASDPQGIENKNRNKTPPSAPDPTRYIYGPEAAVFEAPPPPNPEPPEAEDEVGATLTGRQLAFCERYVERPVAARAARAAGYAEATAAKQASRLLKHPLVMRLIL